MKTAKADGFLFGIAAIIATVMLGSYVGIVAYLFGKEMSQNISTIKEINKHSSTKPAICTVREDRYLGE